MKRGKFITFEGGEGAGKTTQVALLVAELQHRGIAVIQTREPGGTALGEKLRDLLLTGKIKDIGPDVEAIIFATSRALHLEGIIRPALADGYNIICDRFMDSTRAYQGVDGADPTLLSLLEKKVVAATKPDITFILDVDVGIGLARANERRGKATIDRFEADDLAVHEERRQVFKQIASFNKDRCVLINANQMTSKIHDDIMLVMKKRGVL